MPTRKVAVLEDSKRTSLDAKSAAVRRKRLQQRRQTGMPSRQKISELLNLDEKIAEMEDKRRDKNVPHALSSDEQLVTTGQGGIGFVEPIGELGTRDDDAELAARRRERLMARRPTGYVVPTEAERMSLLQIHETEERRRSSVTPRLSKIAAMNAREVMRLTMEERIERGEFTPCPHGADTWCTCDHRHTGDYATFVDPSQPPYTVWHAGTDHALMQIPVGVAFNDDLDEIEERPVEIFNMTGENGFCVQMCNYGARITSILMPDHEGVVEEVMLSFPNMNYVQHYEGHYLGGVLGRMVGLIPQGELRGEKGFCAQLELNELNYHTNGGMQHAFDRLLWQVAIAGKELVFTTVSRDGAGGYPGDALLTARYSVRPPNTLDFHLTITCTKPCPFTPALRLPLNLAGHRTGKMGMLEHVVKVNAKEYYEKNKEERYATGKKYQVSGTSYDLRVPRSMAKLHPKAPWPGYRVLYRIEDLKAGPPQKKLKTEDGDEDAPLNFACKLYHPESRRAVEVFTNQPVLYLETARWTLTVDPEDAEEEAERDRLKRYREALSTTRMGKSILAPGVFSRRISSINEVSPRTSFTERRTSAATTGGTRFASKSQSNRPTKAAMEGGIKFASISTSGDGSGKRQKGKSGMEGGIKFSSVSTSMGDDSVTGGKRHFQKRNTRFPSITAGRKSDIETAEKNIASERSRRRLLFGQDKVKIMEDEVDSEPASEDILEASPVLGRSLFPYYRCGAITLQPQGEPVFVRKYNRDQLIPPDVSKVLLRPGKSLVYACSCKFYIQPKLPQPRRLRHKEKVIIQQKGETITDALAKADTCDLERAESTTSREDSRELPKRIEDMEPDRCSLESVHIPNKAQDRIFKGPPDAEVPTPKRKEPEIVETKEFVPPVNPMLRMAAGTVCPKNICGWATKKGAVRCRPFGYSPA